MSEANQLEAALTRDAMLSLKSPAARSLVPALVSILKKPVVAETRRLAVEALALIGDPVAVEHLIGALGIPDVHEQAAIALGSLDPGWITSSAAKMRFRR